MLQLKNKILNYSKPLFLPVNSYFFQSKNFKNLADDYYYLEFNALNFYHKINFLNCNNIKIFLIFDNYFFVNKTFDFFINNCKNLLIFIFVKNSHQLNTSFKFFLKKQSQISVNFLYFSKSSKNNFYFFIDHLGNNTKSKVNICNFCYNKDSLFSICISRVLKKYSNCFLLQDIKSFNLTDNSNIKNLPILDINNFDNFSKHGCLIGDLSTNLYHYFFSKGISKKNAANLIYKSIVISLLKEINEINLETIFYNNFYLNETSRET